MEIFQEDLESSKLRYNAIPKADPKPCLRHAAQTIARKTTDIPDGKLSLCSECSKTMLSYIFLVQDFLDSLSRKISSNACPDSCLQCVREQLGVDVAEEFCPRSATENHIYHEDTEVPKSSDLKPEPINGFANEIKAALESGSASNHGCRTQDTRNGQLSDISIPGENNRSSRKSSRTKGSRRISRDHDEVARRNGQTSTPQQYCTNEHNQQMDFIYNMSCATYPLRKITSQNLKEQNMNPKSNAQSPFQEDSFRQNIFEQQRYSIMENKSICMQSPSLSQHDPKSASVRHRPATLPVDRRVSRHAASNFPLECEQLKSWKDKNQPEEQVTDIEEPHESNCTTVPDSSSPDKNLCEIMTRNEVEDEAYYADDDSLPTEDTFKDSVVLTGLQGDFSSVACNETKPEAFVTICRNNYEAVGCLVLGTSLLLTRTSKILCVLVSDEVSNEFRKPFSEVFQVVQYVRSLDSLGTTKLALLGQPDLGVSFDKLNVWRLDQFSKCVFLNSDTLVIQNCDELFHHDELSAVPDSGWPDCFNSGVFVFAPSANTFWQIAEFIEKHGNYDGGDQGLLNSYFASWSSDINKKLSFLYNLTANVSYTYTPAFQKFGQQVKIVQFLGSFKPWHVKYCPQTGQVSTESAVHPTYARFVNMWITIFRISVLRLFSQNIQSHVSSQELMCATEILRFFPTTPDTEIFLLAQPSVRLHIAESGLQISTNSSTSRQRRKSAEFLRHSTSVPNIKELNEKLQKIDTDSKEKVRRRSDTFAVMKLTEQSCSSGRSSSCSSDVDDETNFTSSNKQDLPMNNRCLPGAEIGNYHGMQAWEQGRMDYEGNDSSENIIRRLSFLMGQN